MGVKCRAQTSHKDEDHAGRAEGSTSDDPVVLRSRGFDSFCKRTRVLVALINIRDDLPQLRDVIFSSQCFRISRRGAESGKAVVGHSLILRNDFDVEKIAVSWRFFGDVLSRFLDQSFHSFAMLLLGRHIIVHQQ